MLLFIAKGVGTGRTRALLSAEQSICNLFVLE